MNNMDICRRYAARKHSKGRSSNGNLFFEGRVLYSYGYHWPIAVFIDGRVLLNRSHRSATTTRHTNLAACALRGMEIVEVSLERANHVAHEIRMDRL